jgi:regulator of replication initiation timing
MKKKILLGILLLNSFSYAGGENPFIDKKFKEMLKKTIDDIVQEYKKNIEAEYRLKYEPQLEKLKAQIVRMKVEKLKLEAEVEKLKAQIEAMKMAKKKKEEEQKKIRPILVKSFIRVGNKIKVVLPNGAILEEGKPYGIFIVKKITENQIHLIDRKGKEYVFPLIIK